MHPYDQTLEDFRVYETASMLVHEHRGDLIYDGADTGVDPQLRFADPQSSFARVARSLGVGQVRLYVYPPLLADLILPFTFVNSLEAGRLWTALNYLTLLVVALLARSMLQIPWKSLGFVALLVGVFTFSPALACLQWGQVTILLLCLWTLGLFCYMRGWSAASAGALALATAIKLTPLIVVVPFLLWKEWRWLRLYAISLLACLGLTCLISGSASLSDYSRHVMPAMSSGNAFLGNKSLLASFQILYVTMKGGNLNTTDTLIPPSVIMLGKICALACLIVASILVAFSKAVSSLPTRVLTLSLFAALSSAISPVSWGHAYAVCLLALICLWAEALRIRISAVYLVFLTLCSLELSWFALSFPIKNHAHGVAFGLATFLTPLSAIALVLYRLASSDTFSALPSENVLTTVP
jgi:alpha-1,2-mannosyltransferase